jgi:hypothetical protein
VSFPLTKIKVSNFNRWEENLNNQQTSEKETEIQNIKIHEKSP